ncbi:erythrocyte membrane protein 1, PfEMP1,putative [Plasmodium sp.]|nr:erythrocyte membrane protein 1, PfEMP1,putative [Plasmodium sp.]
MESSDDNETSAHKIAQKIQQDAKNGNGNIDKLKAKAHEGQYTDPCKNKAVQEKDGKNTFNRLAIGTKWEPLNNSSNIFVPPRRKYMCTVNLENLDLSKGSPLCGAMPTIRAKIGVPPKVVVVVVVPMMSHVAFYCFADLGDIIRGRDLVETNKNNKESKKGYKQYLKNIKEKHPEIKSNSNYNGDNNLTKLRDDWWAANRDQVWQAMTCKAPQDAKFLKLDILMDD